jgi:hypothetical protein
MKENAFVLEIDQNMQKYSFFKLNQLNLFNEFD